LIWDFRGLDALKTAEHHAIHLKEFATEKDLNFYQVDIQPFSDVYVTAFIIIDESDMINFRDALKPNRGEVA